MGNDQSPARGTGFSQNAIDKMMETSEFFDNTSQEFIQTTADKLRLCLIEHKDILKAQSDWIAPLGILLALLTSVITSDYNDFLGIAGATWETFHLGAMMACSVWLLRSGVRAYRLRGKGDIEQIINSLKLGFVSEPPKINDAIQKPVEIARITPKIFSDNFESFEGWSDYQAGRVVHTSEQRYSGTHSLKKELENDPHGGYKTIGKKINRGILFSGFLFRPRDYSGGNGERLALENEKFSGYGFAIVHRSNIVWIERRDYGEFVRISKQVSFEPPENEWYRFEFRIGLYGSLDLVLKDPLDYPIFQLSDVEDKKYQFFDRIAVHGGYEYYVDNLDISSI